MRFEEIRKRIVNNPGFQTLEEIKQAGYRIVKERDGERYFLARPEELKPLLVRLGDIAEVRFGIKTGANEFFYLQPLDKTVAEVEEIRKTAPHTPIRVKNGAGWEGEIEASWLRPVIKSPREIKTIRVRLEDLHYLVFMPPDDVREMIKTRKKNCLRAISKQYPLAVHYIQWGEKQGYQRRATCKSRQIWWDLGIKINDIIAFPERNQKRYFVLYNPHCANLNKSFYGIKGNLFLVVILNHIISQLCAELIGRTPGGGGGPLDLDVIMTRNISILNTIMDGVLSQSEDIHIVINSYINKSIKNVFEEFSFNLCSKSSQTCDHHEHPYENVRPEELTLERVKQASPDRYELDRIVFDILGLTDEERLDVYRAVVDLVKTRLVKARSV